MWNARLRLASLWLSQVARVAADSCLHLLMLLGLVNETSDWHAVRLLMWMGAAILLAPLNGALTNSLPKHSVLFASAGLALGGALLLHFSAGAGLIAWTLIAIATTIYGVTKYAMYPNVARSCRIPLTRLNGWMETGATLGAVGGILVMLSQSENKRNTALAVAMWMSALALACAAPALFAGDIRRTEWPLAALTGFFRDCIRVLRLSEARGCLIGLACLWGVIVGVIGVIANAFVMGQEWRLMEPAGWIFGGLAVGSWLAGCQPHSRRVLGLVPVGAVGLTIGLLCLTVGFDASPFLCVYLGVMAGLINVPLSATYQAVVPADARGNAMALRYLVVAVVILIVIFLLGILWEGRLTNHDQQFSFLTIIAFLVAIASVRSLLRELLELLTEISIVPFYRVKAIGPGLDDFPMQGPLIVLANHASYLDPVWVAKIIPRQMIPMMTSAFFDLPVIRWLMVNVAHTIRVEASRFRREVPEIQQAIAVLDRGDSLLVFPEGSLRRKEERPLRLFGQGIWHILRERPDTPVVVCWVEGNWGSYFSYRNGPPTKNKRIDIRRPIDIAVSPPQVLDRSLLEDQRATRLYLMQHCLEARRYLGLEPLTLERTSEAVEDEV